MLAQLRSIEWFKLKAMARVVDNHFVVQRFVVIVSCSLYPAIAYRIAAHLMLFDQIKHMVRGFQYRLNQPVTRHFAKLCDELRWQQIEAQIDLAATAARGAVADVFSFQHTH